MADASSAASVSLGLDLSGGNINNGPTQSNWGLWIVLAVGLVMAGVVAVAFTKKGTK